MRNVNMELMFYFNSNCLLTAGSIISFIYSGLILPILLFSLALSNVSISVTMTLDGSLSSCPSSRSAFVNCFW